MLLSGCVVLGGEKQDPYLLPTTTRKILKAQFETIFTLVLKLQLNQKLNEATFYKLL